jgi:hypothetical protein
VHRNQSNRDAIFYPSTNTCLLVGAYTNNPHNLIRYDVQDGANGSRYLSLVLSQHKKSHDVAFTLSCYGTADFTLEKPLLSTPAYARKIGGEWTQEHPSGGNPSHATFLSNPVYKVTLPPSSGTKGDVSNIQIKCFAPQTIPVHIMLLRLQDPTSRELERSMLRQENVVIDIGDYRRGFVCSKVHGVENGATYILIVSTFNVGETGKFMLDLHCSRSEFAVSKLS